MNRTQIAQIKKVDKLQLCCLRKQLRWEYDCRLRRLWVVRNSLEQAKCEAQKNCWGDLPSGDWMAKLRKLAHLILRASLADKVYGLSLNAEYINARIVCTCQSIKSSLALRMQSSHPEALQRMLGSSEKIAAFEFCWKFNSRRTSSAKRLLPSSLPRNSGWNVSNFEL